MGLGQEIFSHSREWTPWILSMDLGISALNKFFTEQNLKKYRSEHITPLLKLSSDFF